jgi:hypothetical protein
VASAQRSVTFDTKVAANGNNTGIIVPVEVIDQLGAGSRPPVVADLNGYEYRNTVGVRGGKHMLSVSAAVREATCLKAGDPVRVRLTLAEGPREVNLPPDFAAALAAHAKAETFFGKLSNSLQRYHVDNINGAKTPETRQQRIDKSITLFEQGKQR